MFKRIMKKPRLTQLSDDFNPEAILHDSHFFRHACASPLTAIHLALEQLDGNKGDTTSDSTCSALKTAVSRLQTLILSGGQERSQFCPLSAIQECLPILQPYRLRIKFLCAGIPSAWQGGLMGSRLLFQEAIICLLMNAAQASFFAAQVPVIILSAHAAGRAFRLDLIDFGVGSTSFADKFEKNLLEHPSGKRGHGLPLISSVIKKQFGGKIYVSSRPEQGTRISLCLESIPLSEVSSLQNNSHNHALS